MDCLPQPGEPLLTERLELRAPTHDDLAALWAIHRDPRAFELDSTPPVATEERMSEVLGTWISQRESQGFGYATVRPRQAPHGVADPSPLLGICGLTRYSLHDRVVLSAYYRFRPDAWGQGVATEAMTALTAQVARALPGAESVVVTDPGNGPSRALAERLGYHLTDERIPDDPGLIVLARHLDGPRPR